ncbi:MAG TPA: ABC transporter permease, partial [Candidatus Saccharimonadia bacterium]|nr:ABC transporter permease [Candidatus Saccharimonadia bacterium]
MSAVTKPAGGQHLLTRVFGRWEGVLLVALAGLILLGAWLSPFFLSAGNFSNLIAALMEVAIMALPMALIIIVGEIDLSV